MLLQMNVGMQNEAERKLSEMRLVSMNWALQAYLVKLIFQFRVLRFEMA